MNDFAPVLVLARDASVKEAVQASALALDVALDTTQGTEDLQRRWQSARLRLVSPEMAGRAGPLDTTTATYIVGRDPEELVRASTELGCPAIMLPHSSAQLANLLAEAAGGPVPEASTIAVTGAVGGLGASTLAVGIGQEAIRRGLRAAVVELAPGGGGLDLLVGKETAAGIRWSDLARARGEIGGIEDALPTVDGLLVLALDRKDPVFPDHPAARAVLTALRRLVDVVVLDDRSQLGLESESQLLLVGADVRSVAAARMQAAGSSSPPSGLVVRTGAGRRLSEGTVSSALGVPLVGALREDRALPRLAEMGEPPLRGPAKRFRRDVASIWEGMSHG
ncbi:MAG: hypothetical protein E7L00_09510 [Propionibacteriaceae bacterium]|nr:hypothetical protein [Propionibacteriaceae bacterium]